MKTEIIENVAKALFELDHDAYPIMSAEIAMEFCPHKVAEHFGVNYSGDVNPFDHGGYFYRSDNWEDYGYADTIGFCTYDNETHLESGCVNMRDDIAEQIRSDFSHESEGTLNEMVNNVQYQIETAKAYHGCGCESEVIAVYSEEDSGGAGELAAWEIILSYLRSWKEELAQD